MRRKRKKRNTSLCGNKNMIDVNELKRLTELKRNKLTNAQAVRTEKFINSWKYRYVCRKIDWLIKDSANEGMDYVFVSGDWFSIVPKGIRETVWKTIKSDYEKNGFVVFRKEDLTYKIMW